MVQLKTDRLTRALYATDACNYRVVPRAVAFPKTDDELCGLVDDALGRREAITMRGRGTSCAGNAVGPGVVIDTAQYMNQILSLDIPKSCENNNSPVSPLKNGALQEGEKEKGVSVNCVNPETASAWVQPGCVMASLQEAAAPYGLRFGPDPSTWTRATLGGMIGNNACGPHAQAWGRTSDNIFALDVIDGNGRRFRAESGSIQALDVVPGLSSLVMNNLALIRTHCGKFSRQVSAYSMEHLLPENGYNLAKFLAGTEGTLAIIRRAQLRLVPIPAAPVLVALGYEDMIQAAADVPTVNTFKPLAVEGLDARLIDVVRRVKGPGAVPELPQGQGWLLVEVGGKDLSSAMKTAQELAKTANTRAVSIYPPGSQASALWRIRADGAGLGGRTPVNPDGSGGDPAWPGWEDAAVPPENLADYLRDFTALMKKHNVDGLLYGHFGDGCVHVRLNLELGSKATVGKAREFLYNAAQIVASYGGSISGEHGDGRARSEFLSTMYPPEMMQLFAQVKALFDPHNLLNPGVIIAADSFKEINPHSRPLPGVAPFSKDLRLLSARNLDDPNAGFTFAGQKTKSTALKDTSFARFGDYTNAIHKCTGVGKCLAMQNIPDSWMCPSYLATGQEKDSTRGRARALQEVANGQLIQDFKDPALLEALDLCLSCKACSTDCPTGMDLATYKSEALWRAYRGRPFSRPGSHWLLGRLPAWLRLARLVPAGGQMANFFLGIKPLRSAVFRVFSIDTRRAMATFDRQSFSAWAAKNGWERKTQNHIEHMLPATDRKQKVAVWIDSFSEGIDHAGARAVMELLEKAGYQPFLPPRTCCGLTWISTGQLGRAKKELGRLCQVLGPLAVNNIPIIGVEPSCTATLREDLPRLLPQDPRAHAISKATKTLAELLTDDQFGLPQLRQKNTKEAKQYASKNTSINKENGEHQGKQDETQPWKLPDLSGQIIVAQPHCHHYAVLGWQTDRELLQRTGAKIVEVKGCCGMAGNFGMEKGHYEVSAAVWEKTFGKAIRQGEEMALKGQSNSQEAHPNTTKVRLLADGFSCRTQAAQMGQRQDAIHLAQLLLGQ